MTVLSPGAGVRLGIPKTPLTLLAYALYRPQYRTWESTVGGPGAEVLQVGINIAIDVTLWTMWSSPKPKSKPKRSK